MANRADILEKQRTILGREMTITAPEEVGRAAIRYFAQAIGDVNPLYFDEEYSKSTRHGGIIAPPTFVCETIYYQGDNLDENGGPVRRLRLPLGLEIRASNDYEFFQPFRPDDILTAHWKVVDVYEKEGATGVLYFLEYDVTYTNQRDELLAINHETLIFRLPEEE